MVQIKLSWEYSRIFSRAYDAKPITDGLAASTFSRCVVILRYVASCCVAGRTATVKPATRDVESSDSDSLSHDRSTSCINASRSAICPSGICEQTHENEHLNCNVKTRTAFRVWLKYLSKSSLAEKIMSEFGEKTRRKKHKPYLVVWMFVVDDESSN